MDFKMEIEMFNCEIVENGKIDIEIKELQKDKKQIFIIDFFNVLMHGYHQSIHDVDDLEERIMKNIVPLIKLLNHAELHFVMKGFTIREYDAEMIFKIVFGFINIHCHLNTNIYVYMAEKDINKERDDLLCLLLQMRHYPEAIIISNDKFRSLNSHFMNDVYYKKYVFELCDLMESEIFFDKKQLIDLILQIEIKIYDNNVKLETAMSEDEFFEYYTNKCAFKIQNYSVNKDTFVFVK